MSHEMFLGHSGSSSAAETRSTNTRGRVAGTADTQQHQSQVGRRIFRRVQGPKLLLDCQRNRRRQGAHRDIPASRGEPQQERGRTPLGLRNCPGMWRTKICFVLFCFFLHSLCNCLLCLLLFSSKVATTPCENKDCWLQFCLKAAICLLHLHLPNAGFPG